MRIKKPALKLVKILYANNFFLGRYS